MDDLIQVLFFLFIVIFGLLGGSRKKKSGAPGDRRPERTPDRPRETAARPREAPAGRSPRVEARRPLHTREDLEASLFDLLRGAQRPEEPPAREPARPDDDEAQSLETLTPAGGASHRRFHERYIERPHAPPVVARAPHIPVGVNARTLRDAVVWNEILGRPKGLD